MADTRVITASCRCGAFKLTHELDASTLPQPHTLCHCTSCRRRTGLLAVLPVNLPAYSPTVQDLAPLSSYTTSTGINPVMSYWCSTCGCSLFTQTTSSQGQIQWALSLGVINDPHGLVDVRGHSFVGDTTDGGLSRMLWPTLPKYVGEDGDLWEAPVAHSPTSSGQKSALQVRCACSAFQAYLKAPNASDSPPKARLKTLFCGCDTCRLVTGSCLPAVPFIFVPLSIVTLDDPSERSDTSACDLATLVNRTGLSRYESTPGRVNRYFCKTCGASVIYHTAEHPNEVSIVAGLANAPDGVLALDWLDWGREVDFIPDAEAWSEEIAREVKNGVAAWNTARS